MYPKKELAQIILAACQFYKVSRMVISPGSRNAPLTLGFTNHPDFTCYSIVDERCAAFFALGIAQQTQKPVALVCTSGSALLNYYPAIAEAYYSQIPLLVISADRPKHLIDVGDGQTIRQENVFANHILFGANLLENSSKQTILDLSKAFNLLYTAKGPVHINAPFDEPLYEKVTTMNAYTFPDISLPVANTVDYQDLANQWNVAAKKMILVGVHYPDAELERLLSKVADDPSVLVLTETTSNLSGSRFITSIDNLIFNQSHQEFLALQPNILLTFGGLIISKKIKKFLRDYQPKEHWHIHELRAFDTYFALTKHIKVDSRTFFKNFSSLVHYNKKSDYKHTWITHRDRTYAKHHYFLHTAPFSDLKVFEQVLHAIPSHSQIHFSNSAIIRYSQLFRISKQFIVFCNRGTSGIDGSTSTAIGAALAFKGQTTLVTGDLSFFYDSNALWNSHIPNTFRIILINNAGGSIFKIIPGPSSTSSLDFFETPHKLTAKHLCNMYGFTYLSANNLEGTVRHLSSLYTESNQPKLLEIFTPSGVNDIILKHYIEYLR